MFSHKKEREVLNLIYSYGLGSIHHEYFDLETKFNHFLQHRRAANLWLLIALSYEKNNQLKKATSSYKKAYKMRKNAYTTYAYARSLDLSKDHKHAIIVYQEFLQKYNQDTTMVGAIKNRLQYLHSLKKGHE
jgi:tetratricopeptide (TPR) repeat protein